MRICRACNQLYTDESFFFCLQDGSKLEAVDAGQVTDILPNMSSLVTVIANRGVDAGQKAFEGKFLYDETATDGLFLKIISSDEEDIELGFRVVVRNLGQKRREIYVAIKALDVDGFLVEDYMYSVKVNPAETRALAEKTSMSLAMFNRITEWNLDEITSHEC